MDGQEPPCSCLKIGLQKIRPVVIWMQQSLGSIRKTKSFDLYSQAPWISGQHMASFLSSSSNLGSKIWHHGYYVGIVLHTYNALLQLEVISPDQFPVLERLCDIFKGPLFNGQRPSRNLLSCCQVWSGATIYFDKERCDGAHGQHRHRSDRKTKKWELRHKEDLSKGGNDPRRCFDPAQISLFHLLASCGYLVDRTVLARIYCSKPSEKVGYA